MGIDRYEDAQFVRSLHSAEEDAQRVGRFLLERLGFECVLLSGRAATRRAINDAICAACATLGKGDQFLFYFAGHGSEHAGVQILLCQDLVYRDLAAGAAAEVVTVESLFGFTEDCGADRVIILDACRDQVRRGVRSAGPAFGVETARNLRRVVDRQTSGGASALLCACDANQQSHEIEALRSGAFSHVFLNEFARMLDTKGFFALPDDVGHLAGTTRRLLAKHGIFSKQVPWCAHSGRIVLGVEPKNEDQTPPSPPSRRSAPTSGKRRRRSGLMIAGLAGFLMLVIAGMIGSTHLPTLRTIDRIAELQEYEARSGETLPPFLHEVASLANGGDERAQDFFDLWLYTGNYTALTGLGGPPGYPRPRRSLPDEGEWMSRLRAAASGGDPVAAYLLGVYLAESPRAEGGQELEALRFLETAALAGSGEALLFLGDLYRHGGAGVVPDFELARAYYGRALNRGVTTARERLEGLP
ncbi:MAG: caspase family protein [Opitutales bacterium]|nr:caspase family protein [Opitutales bacterium]